MLLAPSIKEVMREAVAEKVRVSLNTRLVGAFNNDLIYAAASHGPMLSEPDLWS